ncbi:MAG: queuosine precursor transporter [Alphaproteobacteria bacterium]|nr:queuosine precursor transporter [Alphaproteobacteria bacterium]
MHICLDAGINALIQGMQTQPPELISLLSVFICGLCIVLAQRLFGLYGLMTYNVLAVVLANIQVLRLCQFSFLSEPVALGTILFATLFLTTNMITEYYGAQAAKTNIQLCFFGMIITSVLMVIDLGHRPVSCDHPAYQAMVTLFVPSVRILIASLCAFFVSQYYDVLVFKLLKQRKAFLWLRTMIASLSSSLLDNLIFGLLAWRFLSETPLDFKSIVMTYILGAFLARAVVGIALTPIIYMGKRSEV